MEITRYHFKRSHLKHTHLLRHVATDRCVIASLHVFGNIAEMLISPRLTHKGLWLAKTHYNGRQLHHQIHNS